MGHILGSDICDIDIYRWSVKDGDVMNLISIAFVIVTLIVIFVDVIIGLLGGVGDEFLKEFGWPLLHYAYILLTIAIILVIFW